MGSGHALESFKRLKDNISLKKQHNSKYGKMKKSVSNIKAKYHEFNDRSTLNEEELKSFFELRTILELLIVPAASISFLHLKEMLELSLIFCAWTTM